MQNQTVRTIFEGRNELTPVLNQMSGSLTNFGRHVQQVNNQNSQGILNMSRAWGIFKRSFDYAISGVALYKLEQALSIYKNFRSELGLLNANLKVSNDQLNRLGNTAISVSTKTAVPVNQVLQSYQNLASTFPNLPKALYPQLATIEARGSRLTQVEPQQYGTVVTQLATQFYGRKALTGRNGNKILEGVASQLLSVLYNSPGTSGQALLSYIPNLAGAAVSAQFSLPQALSLFEVAQRSSGRPAQTMQYLRQLLLRLRQPTAKERPYFAQAIPLNNIANLSGQEILTGLIQHALNLGGATAGGKPVNYQQALSSGFKGLKVGGQAEQFLLNAIGGRMQSTQAINAVIRGIGQLPIASKQVQLAASTDLLNRSFQKWLDQNQLTQTAQDFSNLSLTLVNDLNPAIQDVARVAGGAASDIMKANRGLTRGAGYIDHNILGGVGLGHLATRYHIGGATEILAGILGISGAKRGAKLLARPGGLLSRLPVLGKMLGRSAGVASEAGAAFGTLFRAPLDIQAMSSAITGIARGTPTAPFWVVIHPLSTTTVPGLFGGKGGTGGTGKFQKILDDLKKLQNEPGAKEGEGAAGAVAVGARQRIRSAAARAAARIGQRATGLIPEGGASDLFGLGAGGLLAGTATGGAAMFFTSDGTQVLFPPTKKGMTRLDLGGGYYRQAPKNSYLAQYLKRAHGRVPAGVQGLLTRFGSGTINESQAEKGIRRYLMSNWNQLLHHDTASRAYKLLSPMMTAQERAHFYRSVPTQKLEGHGAVEATFYLQPTPEFANILKPQKVKAHIPVSLIPSATPPTERGKQKVHKSR